MQKRQSGENHARRGERSKITELGKLEQWQILEKTLPKIQSYDTFQQRHLINDTYWGGASNNPPIFVYMGNEADIEWFAQNTGFMFDKAPNFRALLVFIEHRHYGQSIPMKHRSIPFGGDKNIANKNTSTLGYLSSTQALADYATLIIDLKKNLSAIDSPVVFIGGSIHPPGGRYRGWVGVIFGRGSSIFEDMEAGLEMFLACLVL
ncbi:hypothetical protein HYC85_015287 [Camellia sinensis]|uniref:Uncharacterized protein n=1 Tax=Camellia sinensis TaxID=4442 RepID=A0A7J7GWE2_CAMSI|nr:hypothetical protein HYC85_015287 [Camellia sinensis]